LKKVLLVDLHMVTIDDWQHQLTCVSHMMRMIWHADLEYQIVTLGVWIDQQVQPKDHHHSND
jgi:hypothetical protein